MLQFRKIQWKKRIWRSNCGVQVGEWTRHHSRGSRPSVESRCIGDHQELKHKSQGLRADPGKLLAHKARRRDPNKSCKILLLLHLQENLQKSNHISVYNCHYYPDQEESKSNVSSFVQKGGVLRAKNKRPQIQ